MINNILVTEFISSHFTERKRVQHHKSSPGVGSTGETRLVHVHFNEEVWSSQYLIDIAGRVQRLLGGCVSWAGGLVLSFGSQAIDLQRAAEEGS